MTFQYDKLPNNGFFRVFELHPGKDSDPLQGNLRTYLRKQAPKYEALSYVWGSSVQNQLMKLNDQTFMITDSLDVALRRLRLVGDSRCLWVDQICINQTSLDERSEQVSIMRDIYSGAALVNAWLGPADAEEASAVEMIISTLAKRRPHELRAQQYFPENEYLQELGLPTRDSTAWGALNSMLDAPYFSRVWILQELALAATYTLLWGDLIISKADFLSFKMATFRLRMHRQDPRAQDWIWVKEDSQNPCPEIEWTSASIAFTDDYRKVMLCLYELVSSTQGCHATDPRDKIFALLGLAGDRTYGIIPDYHKPESTVFAEFTLNVISETMSLDILNHTDIEDPNNKEQRPLWAPRWHTQKTLAYFDMSYHGFESSYNKNIRMKSSVNSQALKLRGLHIDNVRETHNWNDSIFQNLMAIGSLAIDQECLLKYQYGSDIITPIVLTMMSGREQSRVGETKLSRPTNDSYLNSFTAFAFQSLLGTFSDKNDKKENKRHREVMIQLIKMAVQTCLFVPQNESVFGKPEVWELINGRLAQLSPDDMETLLSHMDILKGVSSDVEDDSMAFWRDIVSCRGRKFFVTEKGYIGNGLSCVEPGDSVCILFGGDTPYIVRPNSPSSNEYLFLGNAYVHGIMDGEAITTWEGQKDSDDAKFQEQLFNLL
ncbi:het-6OR heterokaryon incompatibility (het-6OR allele) [Fusarium pseudocircinatum]|uniref:Het-6OR heterokaryon incompatibility (Het-6OR allele) n=1 Tax=Fusarium pseudocircinatum TaxID=56676 RepID=A0A8H5NQF9_9HYPO|nr:het-6OR heterokaryon incompatibility (het-6OR allele) [Fusarium pseudocircinatum]